MIPGDSALGIQRSALSLQRSALHFSPELGVLVGKQMQEADFSPFSETEEIPDLRDLFSLIEENNTSATCTAGNSTDVAAQKPLEITPG